VVSGEREKAAESAAAGIVGVGRGDKARIAAAESFRRDSANFPQSFTEKTLAFRAGRRYTAKRSPEGELFG